MKLFALVGAGLLAAGTMAAAPADAQHYGRHYSHYRGGHAQGYRHAYGHRSNYGYRHGGYRSHGWRPHHRYERCRFRRCY